MNVEAAPANASRDQAVRRREARAPSTCAESSRTNSSRGSARWLRSSASGSDPRPRDLRWLHMGWLPSCLELVFEEFFPCHPYTPDGGQNLTFELENGQSRCYREVSRLGLISSRRGQKNPAVADCKQEAERAMTESQ